MNYQSSIPIGLNISENFRLLCYLKTKYKPGYFHKSEIERLSRIYKKDSRTFKKLLRSLLDARLIGENQSTIFLRSWKFISNKLQIGTRAFSSSLTEMQDKKLFEAKQFAAKVEWLTRHFRKKDRTNERALTRGCSNQIASSIPSGYLVEAVQASAGKIVNLKRIAALKGFLIITKTFTPICAGSEQAANLLNDQFPGCFVKDGVIVRRAADAFKSLVLSYRIKNRKSHVHTGR
jgi:hypothetical protein